MSEARKDLYISSLPRNLCNFAGIWRGRANVSMVLLSPRPPIKVSKPSLVLDS